MKFNKLTTPWGETIDDKPLLEYPRPQLVRDSYFNLNGWWDFEISKEKNIPLTFSKKILVPFSPESQLSGINCEIKKDEYLYYRLKFTLPVNFKKDLVILHFGAIDTVSDIYLNNNYLFHHEGGYTCFDVDITNSLNEKENTLIVKVKDFLDHSDYPNGKQSSKRGGIWYTPQSGIWQTVWLESVNKQYIKGLKITPNIDTGEVLINLDNDFKEKVTVTILDHDKEIVKATGIGTIKVKFPDSNYKLWSPEDPFLYDLKIESKSDIIKSYFGMRKFSVEKIANNYRLMLNNKPYFHNGVLDQGYWCDGLYTPPCDQALIYDIQMMKDLGFNMLRKHIKIESMRYYYHCDKIGMLVWQDMPSGGNKQNKFITIYLPWLGIDKINDNRYKLFSSDNTNFQATYKEEYVEMIQQLYNCVCISTWVPFNEGWGQFDANEIVKLTKQYDQTRLIDHASGWHDQGGGDIKSLHVYFKRVHLPKKDNRAICLSEFGGYSYKIKNHSYNLSKTFSYKRYKNREKFNQGLKSLYKKDILSSIDDGLSACVYTQLSDVEDEVNGLLTYDRRICKVDTSIIKNINKQINFLNNENKN